MAQHDYNIANASGATVRADLNNALLAIVSQNSGATAPTTTFAYMPWADSTTGLLKFRNAANTAWVTVGTLASTNLGLVVAPASSGTANQVLATDGAGVQSWVDRSRLVQGTTVATTSGTSVDFTSLPTWVKKVTIALSGVSLSGTANPRLQIGPVAGVETTNYLGTTGFLQNASTSGSAVFSAGFDLISTSAAANLYHGAITLTQVEASTNTWAAMGVVAMSNSAIPAMIGGSKALAGALSIVRLTSSNGTDTFDAGKVNIIYEG